jgi:transcription elongation GreA/GreB family factor
MSRAFTTERDDAPEPVISTHILGVRVPITAAGRAQLVAQRDRAQSPAERKRLADLVADLIVPDPPADRAVVAFGAGVWVRSETIGRRRFEIVGPDETDVAAGRISLASPLGRALLGARAGDVVIWHRPVGDLTLTIESVEYPSPEVNPQERVDEVES